MPEQRPWETFLDSIGSVTSVESVAVSRGLLGKLDWMRMLKVKAQLGLIWGEIKEILLPLGCSQCGCSCPQSPGNLLILLLFLIWHFRRKYHQWLPTKRGGSQNPVLPFLCLISHNLLERAKSWKRQSWKGLLFHKKKEKEEEEEQEDEEEKEEDLLRQRRLNPWWCFYPNKMEAEPKTPMFQRETLGTPGENVGSLCPSFWGPGGTYQPFGGSERFPGRTVTPDPVPNSYYLPNPAGLIQVPSSLGPPSASSAKAKGSIQLFWGLPSLHSESLEIVSKSGCTFPMGATTQQPFSDTPLIFFNELSYLPLPNLLVKAVSLPPPCLPSISPFPALHANCEDAEMAFPELPNDPKISWWTAESQEPILDPLLPLFSPPHSPVGPQEIDFLEVTKVMASEEYEVPGSQDIQQSELAWLPESLAQTPSSTSVPFPETRGVNGPMEDLKVRVSEALLEDQWQTQLPQDPEPSTPLLSASPPHLPSPQRSGLMGTWSEMAPMTLPGPKAPCYNTQQSELPWATGTSASCLSPQGTGLTASPRVPAPMALHAPEGPWYNTPAGPPAPGLTTSSQTELQGASPIQIPEGTAPSWDIMRTQPLWTPVLPALSQAEPQGASSKGAPVPLAGSEPPGWGVQPWALRHDTPPLEPPSQMWPPPDTGEDERCPPETPSASGMPQEEGAMGETPLPTRTAPGPGAEGCAWNKEPQSQFKKHQHNPDPHSLASIPPFPGLFFPTTSIPQELCPPTCQIPAPNLTHHGTVGTPPNCVHVQAKKAMSQGAQPLLCQPAATHQPLLQELARDGQDPAREGKEAPLASPQIPDLQATKVAEPQPLSQYYKSLAAAKMPYAPRRPRVGGSEKPGSPAPGKSHAKAAVLGRKREHSRRAKAGDQGGGDAGWGKSQSSSSKKPTSRQPARRSLVPPQRGRRNFCQAASQLPPKPETPQVLPAQDPSKGQGAGGGDSSSSRHPWSRSQGGRGPRRESCGPAKRGLQKFLGGLLNNLSYSPRTPSVESLQAAQDPRSGQALHPTPQ
ncbi:spermatogenesis-associated protein 31G1 [Sminthopsis crassicaudata]|uniref:spermatogenesis-associated protein 31G1 n=1 Tax=Sminthopsis crassicaudata TaxID=9301 RepID=UPI003D694566